MKRLGLKILGLLIMAIVLCQSNVLLAVSQNDLNETNKKIDEAEKELSNIQNEKSDTVKQVEQITTQISEYQTQIDVLDGQISDLNTKISESQEQLKKAEEDYSKQEELLEARLIATYEAGETSYLDFILSSESITDLISNYYLITEVATNDTELLDKIQKQKKEIEEAKQKLEGSKQELAISKASKQSVTTQLKTAQQEKNQQVAKLSEDEKQTQAELEQFEADKRAIANQLAAIAKQEAARQQAAQQAATQKNKPSTTGGNGGGKTPSSSGNSGGASNTVTNAGGFIRPVSGYGITCGWYGYAGHTGVDFSGAGISGRPVLAAKSGTVAISTALTNGNGGYRSYGEYIAINHHDGTMTLYAHGAPGSRLVSVGQSVSQGQQIMSVGTTGNSTGYHLHFEVWLNGVRVNPANYL